MMKISKRKQIFLLAAICSIPLQLPASDSQVIPVDGDTRFTHDPFLIKDANTWYVFSTGNGPDRHGELPIRCSPDLRHWKRCGAVLPSVPQWIKKESPQTKELWAPDIAYFNGEFHLYYAFSVFGKNTSGIAMLTNRTLDPKKRSFRWVDRGLVLRSRVEDDFNAIDPNIVFDTDGTPWLSFGSFWTGIKMRKIDGKTGLLAGDDSKLYSLAKRKPRDTSSTSPGLPGSWQAIEAPFVIQRGDYYYLFVSFDLCCRGVKSSYRTMVGRSINITGPYVDKSGIPMLEGGGTLVLAGNQRWAGPGGESVSHQSDADIMIFHAYDSSSGDAYMQLSTIDWSDGWPKVKLSDR
jgi:arabinan endo-1,5-alpha-L-arabinosidase